ncbi:hypothetical protein [Flavobacterium sp. ZT3R25]|uniref:hypothetical protein n=1 Tax=Flavobacterium TaxID=237 RepID=UPI003A8BACBA
MTKSNEMQLAGRNSSFTETTKFLKTMARVRDSSGKPAEKWNEMEFFEDLQRKARPIIKKEATTYTDNCLFFIMGNAQITLTVLS